jgi:hypothetical protein
MPYVVGFLELALESLGFLELKVTDLYWSVTYFLNPH